MISTLSYRMEAIDLFCLQNVFIVHFLLTPEASALHMKLLALSYGIFLPPDFVEKP